MSQFGGRPEDGYDYFAGPAAGAGSGIGSGIGSGVNAQFGSAPAEVSGPATPPDQVSPWPYAAPVSGGSTQQPSRRRRWPWVALVVAAVLVLLVAGGVVNIRARHREPLTMPPTLGGMAPATDPALVAQMDVSEVQAQHPGWAASAKAYGTKKGVVLLFAARGPVKLDREFADFSSASGVALTTTETKDGATTCRSDATGLVTYCVRTSAFLTVEVAGVKVDPAVVGAAVNEAWGQQ